ncbi:MAG: hypothetical protein ABMA25_22425 [Ilumatobacteraceae bacterium]
MHEDLVTPDRDADGAADTDSRPPTRPVTPLVQLGAPVVGDLEPVTPAALTEDTDVEPAPTADAIAAAHVDSSVLRRAALLRLVGLGRSRAMR